MEQKLVKKNDLIEFSNLYFFLIKYDSKQEQKDIKQIKKQYELYQQYKTLNPKYTESITILKDAKITVESSDIIHSSNFNVFRSY
ncbi:MAG: hypothetical protein ACXADU_13900 [Promethearchaeota archaeon]